MLVDIHMIKSFQPTNLNRDDTGAPKTCMFGGFQRSRISSQCLKRSWRTSELLREEIGERNISIRTRKLPDLIEEKLRKENISDEYISIIRKKVTGFGTKEGTESKDERTAQIIAYSADDIADISSLIMEELKNCTTKKEVEKISIKDVQKKIGENIKRSVTLDTALFGRMVTSEALSNVEASMQVAHAISTNRVFMESDFFTAVDDLISGNEAELGSGMLGDIDYNSSCYYIYASLDTDKLSENLRNVENAEEIMQKIVPVMINTMAMTNPSGKQNSFAGHSLPSAVLVECKTKHIPVSYANAFEVPIKPDKERGLVSNSIASLKKECESIAKDFDIPVEKRLWYSKDTSIVMDENVAVNCNSFKELLMQIPQV